eukprot:1134947-Prorocentrum_minimum.AAC.1
MVQGRPHFLHSLEWLLFTALDVSAASASRHRRKGSHINLAALNDATPAPPPASVNNRPRTDPAAKKAQWLLEQVRVTWLGLPGYMAGVPWLLLLLLLFVVAFITASPSTA